MPEKERANQSPGSMLEYKKIKDIPEAQKGKDEISKSTYGYSVSGE
jgi:hypothetical protein